MRLKQIYFNYLTCFIFNVLFNNSLYKANIRLSNDFRYAEPVKVCVRTMKTEENLSSPLVESLIFIYNQPFNAFYLRVIT